MIGHCGRCKHWTKDPYPTRVWHNLSVSGFCGLKLFSWLPNLVDLILRATVPWMYGRQSDERCARYEGKADV